MLRHVRVRNIALIDEADIDFSDGLNVLTGETGAGKSILLGAINLALGARAGKEIVRDPGKGASVDLLFFEERPSILAALEEMGIVTDDGEILISRRFTPAGRAVCSVNDAMVSTGQVKAIASLLIDIHGQHDHQSLLDASRHIDLLDRFIPEMKTRLPEMREAWDKAETIRKELDFYEESGRDRARLLGLMEYELNEITAADWIEGEEEALAEEKKRLMYAEKLNHGAMEAFSLMEEDGYQGKSALSLLNEALGLIQSASRYDEEFFGPFATSMAEQISILEDTAAELRDYGEKMEADPERLDEIEDRITLLSRLKDKYGATREQVLAYLDKRQQEYDKLKNLDETVERLRDSYETASCTVQKAAGELTRLRKKAAERVEGQITAVLSTLQFEDPVFKVQIEEKAVSPSGADAVIFMIRTNVGEKIMPLSKIASGGEMSRVMLAIKTVLAEQDEIGTMIFDEIDTGISGRTAQSVAEKMDAIGRFHQVICVTHLPQIAAMADHHLRIEKTSVADHTFTRILPLCEEETVEELSRMLGGLEITEAVRQNAAEMRRFARGLKEAR